MFRAPIVQGGGLFRLVGRVGTIPRIQRPVKRARRGFVENKRNDLERRGGAARRCCNGVGEAGTQRSDGGTVWNFLKGWGHSGAQVCIIRKIGGGTYSEN